MVWATKRSIRLMISLGSIGPYVGYPLDKMTRPKSIAAWYNSRPFDSGIGSNLQTSNCNLPEIDRGGSRLQSTLVVPLKAHSSRSCR